MNTGVKLVSYVYDAWGNFTVSYHNGGENTYAANNPYRYRGYYYDIDLGLYYLNSRYYDSNTGRFISADEYVYTGQALLGANMFAYCLNNPVNYIDDEGTDAIYVANYGYSGLIIVGHALLYYQDDSGTWFLTEYNGEMFDKTTAQIYNYELRDFNLAKNMQKWENGYYVCYYLKGDYSSIYDFAEKYKGSNYGGYHLLYNNCLKYVDDALNYARYGNNKSNYDDSYIMIPSAYVPNTSPLNSLGADGNGGFINKRRTFSVVCFK